MLDRTVWKMDFDRQLQVFRSLLRHHGDALRVGEVASKIDQVPNINNAIAARAAARKAKNFAEADRIRAELDAMGVALKDAKDPQTGELVTTWEVKR
jgi:cysteinyl-tRNA synthetase